MLGRSTLKHAKKVSLQFLAKNGSSILFFHTELLTQTIQTNRKKPKPTIWWHLYMYTSSNYVCSRHRTTSFYSNICQTLKSSTIFHYVLGKDTLTDIWMDCCNSQVCMSMNMLLHHIFTWQNYSTYNTKAQLFWQVFTFYNVYVIFCVCVRKKIITKNEQIYMPSLHSNKVRHEDTTRPYIYLHISYYKYITTRGTIGP